MVRFFLLNIDANIRTLKMQIFIIDASPNMPTNANLPATQKYHLLVLCRASVLINLFGLVIAEFSIYFQSFFFQCIIFESIDYIFYATAAWIFRLRPWCLPFANNPTATTIEPSPLEQNANQAQNNQNIDQTSSVEVGFFFKKLK